MSTALVSVVYNGNVPMKNMISDPEWFNGDRTKFKDWWREIRLFLKSNKVVAANDKITAVLAWLRRGIVGIYAQRKINELENIEDTQDWEEFIREIKIVFSNKSKIADAEWKIKMF